MTRGLAILLAALAAGCGGSDTSSTGAGSGGNGPGAGGSSGGSAGQPSGDDPCAPLANGTDLSGCVPSFCECADGTVTRTGGGCMNGVGFANCTFGCAQHGGTGTPRPLENVYSSPECLAYCQKLHAQGCPTGAEASLRNSVSKRCSFLRVVPSPETEPGATCAEAARKNLTCLVETSVFTCEATGFSSTSQCGQIDDVYEENCSR